MLLALPILLTLLYFLIAKLLIFFPSQAKIKEKKNHTIHILYGDIHTDIVISLKDLNNSWFKHIQPIKDKTDGYLAIGWGDKASYLHPGSYDTLPLSIIVKALFINTSSLIHVSYYKEIKNYKQVREISISKQQLLALKSSLFKDFDFGSESYKGYYPNDYFYTSPLHYNAIDTCNTWTGDKLREVNISMSYWTPFRDNVMDSLP